MFMCVIEGGNWKAVKVQSISEAQNLYGADDKVSKETAVAFCDNLEEFARQQNITVVEISS